MRIFFLVAIALFTVAGFANTAEAKAKIVVYHHGPAWYETGPLPDAFANEKEFKNFTAGYQCQTFGLFWANLHWWNCEPIAIKGNGYLDRSDAPKLIKAIEDKYTKSDIQMGMWEAHGRWLMLLIVLVLLATRFMGDDEEEDEA